MAVPLDQAEQPVLVVLAGPVVRAELAEPAVTLVLADLVALAVRVVLAELAVLEELVVTVAAVAVAAADLVGMDQVFDLIHIVQSYM